MEKLGRQFLNPATAGNIPSNNVSGYHVPLSCCDGKGSSLLGYSSPMTHNPSSVSRTSSDKPRLRYLLQNTWSALLKTVKVRGKKEDRETGHRAKKTGEAKRVKAIQSQTESWNRKGTLVNFLVKLVKAERGPEGSS